MSRSTDVYSVAQFVGEARAVVARAGITDESLRQVGDLMRRLAQVPGLIPDGELAAMHGTDSTATVLHSDGQEALTLVLAKFSDKAPTPIHDHDSWGVACVVQGRDLYQHWERTDNASEPNHAELRLLYEKELGPGEGVCWRNPPHDIHRQQGLGAPVWELVLFGKNAMALPRHYFDLETGSVRVALPQ
jgi:predicted metal-dependent enzyme (double-stranded beta helix superfamily)